MNKPTKKQTILGVVGLVLTASLLIGGTLLSHEQPQVPMTTKEAPVKVPAKPKAPKKAPTKETEKTTKQTSPSSKPKSKEAPTKVLETNGTVDEAGNEDFSTMDRPSVEELNEAQKNRANVANQFVGELYIPDISLTLNILEGTTYQKMLYGATTLLPNQVMGKGNYALASHNMGVEHRMFTSIYQLQKGADIFLTHPSGQRFRYQVVSNDVVDFRNTDKLNLTKKPTVTLVTCQSVQTTNNRVVVQAELVS